MPRRRPSAPFALAALLCATAVLAACGDDEADEAADVPPSTVQEGQVAAVAVTTGDCLNGVVVGAAERAEVHSAEVVSCDRPHGLEVFATFTLGPDDFDEDQLAEYPGRPRVVAAADAGCTERMDTVIAEDEDYGLIALWPSATSWRAGDRSVACAVFSRDGSTFEGRQL